MDVMQSSAAANADRIRRSLVHTIHATMPSAAVASGWASEVDYGPWIEEISQRFPLDTRPENHGLPFLTEWLAERGVTAGINALRALRLEWLKERMRVTADREYERRKAKQQEPPVMTTATIQPTHETEITADGRAYIAVNGRRVMLGLTKAREAAVELRRQGTPCFAVPTGWKSCMAWLQLIPEGQTKAEAERIEEKRLRDRHLETSRTFQSFKAV